MRISRSVHRRKQILELLIKTPVIRVSALQSLFDVSDETIRKDLIDMERQRVLVRRHGHVESLVSSSDEEAVDVRVSTHLEEKERIAQAALQFIPDTEDQVIGLDAGTTTWCLARLLVERKGQTIVTNSMKIADLFVTSDLSNDLYCPGGVLRAFDKAFYGPWTVRSLNSIRTTIAVLSTNGVRNWDGLGSVSYDDADVKREFAKNSQYTIAILDSSKFETSTLLESVKWEELDMVITGTGICDYDRERIEQKTRLLIV